MQFRDLKTQYQNLKPEIDAATIKVCTDCDFISGAQVEMLEKKLAEYVGRKHCVTCANGTDALSLAMMAWGIGASDGVFVPDFTFFSSGEIVSASGATPIFVDVELDTFNMNVSQLEKQIKKVIEEGELVPKVIIAVDLFGLPANYIEIKKIAKKYKLLILEDGAQGFGGKLNGKKACSFGDISITSFFPAKPLGCYGDGGAIFVDNDEIAEMLKSLRAHGKGENKYDNVRLGLNSRLDTLQASILLIKLNAFKNYELKDINVVANKYTELLKNIVITPIIPEGFYSSWAQYTIRLKSAEERNELQKKLKDKGIPSMIYYKKPMHLQKAFDNKIYDDGNYVNTLKLCNTVLSLPIHPYMSDEVINEVCVAIKNIVSKRG